MAVDLITAHVEFAAFVLACLASAMNSNEDELKLAYLRHKQEALEQGMAFAPDEPRVAPGETILFSSLSYSTKVKLGQQMDFSADVGNSGTKSALNLSITAFVGPGPFFTNAGDGIAARDQNWPILYTDKFNVLPGTSTRSVMGFRVPEKLVTGSFLLSLILWQEVHTFQPARIWDRWFWRFEVIS